MFGDQLLDVNKKPIFCRGSWNSPVNTSQLLSAVTCIHAAKKQSGAYFDSCNGCVQAMHEGIMSGCRFHSYSPNHWRKGLLIIIILFKEIQKSRNFVRIDLN